MINSRFSGFASHKTTLHCWLLQCTQIWENTNQTTVHSQLLLPLIDRLKLVNASYIHLSESHSN